MRGTGQPFPHAPAAAWRLRPYPQVLRGPGHRWWRPPVGLVAMVASTVLVAGAVAALLRPPGTGEPGPVAAGDLLALNLSVAMLLPPALFAVWVGHGWGPGHVASVTGRLRREWLGVAAGVCLLVVVPPAVGLTLLAGVASGPREPGATSVVAVVLLTTPMQAAAEEYVFRGWLNQAVGSLFDRPGVAVAAGAVVSSTAFALAHGAQGGWLFADRWLFGLAAALLTWRTGGLEAAIALHAVVNMVAWGQAVALGTVRETVEVSSMPMAAFVAAVGQLALAVGALLWAARRARPARLFRPPGPPTWSRTPQPGVPT